MWIFDWLDGSLYLEVTTQMWSSVITILPTGTVTKTSEGSFTRMKIAVTDCPKM